MIYHELQDLEQYLVADAKVNAGVGNKEIGPGQYPYVRILPNLPFPNWYDTSQLALVNFQVMIVIIVDWRNEADGFRTLERILEKLDQFNRYKGHKFVNGSVISPEYTDDTYELSFPYMMKVSVQDT